MSTVNITVGSQVIKFPLSGEAPNYAPAIVQFAEAVATQLQTLSSAYDVSPRMQILSLDANTNLSINNATFPHASVRNFTFTYAISRKNASTTIVEEGVITGVYDGTISSWILQQDFSGDKDNSTGLPYHSFSMSGDQLQFSCSAMGGTYDSTNSRISYFAKTTLVNNT